MAIINPYILTSIVRFRYYEFPSDWKAVTREHTYEDGGKSFNLLSDAAPKKWELIYQFDTDFPQKKAEMRAFDEHFEYYGFSRPFDFLTKEGLLLQNVYYFDYDRTHEGHGSWQQTRRTVLIKYDFTPVVSSAPSVPTGLSVATFASAPTTALVFSWLASAASLNRTIEKYLVKRDGVLLPEMVRTNGVLATEIAVGTLSPNTLYTFTVAAADNTGEQSIFATPVSGKTSGSDTTAPIVGVLSAAWISSARIDLSWTAASDAFGISGYELTRSTSSAFTFPTTVNLANVLAYSDTGIPKSPPTYYYRLRAFDASGNYSAYSNTVEVAQPPTPTPITFTISEPSSLPSGTTTVAYVRAIATTGGELPHVSVSVTAGALPSGMTASIATGNARVSGTPSAMGTFSPTISITDSLGNVATKAFTLTVAEFTVGTTSGLAVIGEDLITDGSGNLLIF